MPKAEQLPVASNIWSAAAICSKCRKHLDITINFPANTSPCPSGARPFHFFKHVSSAAGADATKQSFQFQCFAETCRAELLVEFRDPILNAEDVSYLTDPATLRLRFKTAQAKYPDVIERPALKVLDVLCTAINDALRLEKKRDIPVENKLFTVCLGDGIEGIFSKLEFAKHKPIGGKQYWKLPDPSKHLFDPHPDELRARLENARDELVMLMLQRPENERKLVNWTPPMLAPAQQALERVLSISGK